MKINEIFKSIQGESSHAGYPCTFVRLAGCNLTCSYCDTPTAESYEMGIDEILDKIDLLNGELVEVTGGEPLLQEESALLCERLIEKGKTVLVETNGSLDINVIPRPAVVIMDIKTPQSLMSESFDWENINRLKKTDEVKFVICGRPDYDWARQKIDKYELNKKARLLISPVYGRQDAKELASWILEDNLPIRLQLQLHKIIWGAYTKGV
jgi:7-carboxy-7-deazaguanine synthase